jgi:hypothetical protein
MNSGGVTQVAPADIRAARATLGKMWGLNRPLHMSEMGRALRLKGRDPGKTIDLWENYPDKHPISGPASVAIEAMLAGFRPG